MNLRTLKKIFIRFFALLALSPIVPSWSAGIGVDCIYPDTLYIYLPPMTINAGRDTAPGDLMGSWITTSANPTWTCYRPSTAYGVIHMGIAGYGPYTKYGTITVDGQNFAIYQSAVKAGLGYIVRWRTIYNGQTSNWQALSSAPGVWTPPETLFGPIEFDSQIRFSLNAEIQVHLVKTSNTLTAGNVSAFDPIYIQPYRSLNSGGSNNQGPYRIVQYQTNGLQIAAGGTCTTPNVSVTIPPVPASSFNGVGTTAGITPFNLSFNNCPAGLNSIGYSFAPTTTIANAAQGVVTLDASSTAKGIGIQVMAGDDTPIQYGTVYNLTNYDPLNANSYSVPLKAALYQISSPVSAGKVKGAITFTMSYK